MTLVLPFVVITWLSAAADSVWGQTAPPLPPFTNGDGDPYHNGMKHAMVSLTGQNLAIHVDAAPQEVVAMQSGFGVDFDPSKFDVLEDRYFNAQHGWLPDGQFVLEPNELVWIRRIEVEQPADSEFRIYEGGNGREGIGAWTMQQIYQQDGDAWQWDGAMQHDYFTADRPGEYRVTFEAYIGDDMGIAIPAYAPAQATFSFPAVPEPGSLALAALGVAQATLRRRKSR
ncbi:MAG: PEP-CTERM sorting domain-containing protein [Planctomycetales bacterium]|nr:PEP-CTERM sorting domain-containing protein [Planctomycetales bacterium]